MRCFHLMLSGWAVFALNFSWRAASTDEVFENTVIRSGRCQLSWGRIEGLEQHCYQDIRLFGTAVPRHGPTPVDCAHDGVMSLQTNGLDCEATDRTGSVSVVAEDDAVTISVTPDEGKEIFSFGVYFLNKEFFEEEIQEINGNFRSYPAGKTNTVSISFGNACNDRKSALNYWMVTAMICDKGSESPTPPPPTYYCVPSWGRVTGVAPTCLLDETLFPTIAWSSGKLDGSGNYTGVMEQFPANDSCIDGAVTGQLNILLDCGKSEFFVTPEPGYKVYSVEVMTSETELTDTGLMRYTGSHKTVPDGSHNTHRIATGRCTGSGYSNYLVWSVYALICDENAPLPPPLTGNRR